MSSQPSWIVRINLRGLGEKTCCCFHHTFVIGFLRALLTKFEILVLRTQNTIRDGGRTALKTAYTACTTYILLTSLTLLWREKAFMPVCNTFLLLYGLLSRTGLTDGRSVVDDCKTFTTQTFTRPDVHHPQCKISDVHHPRRSPPPV